MATNQAGTFEPFRLFSSSDNNNGSQLGLGLFDSPEKPLPPPPPCLEILPSSQVLSSAKHTVEPVNFDGLTLLKGRVSTQDVFALSNSDLVPGKYEGGLKLWEGSLDLVKALRSEVEIGQLSLTGKRVLEDDNLFKFLNVPRNMVPCLFQLGCGHGLPGIVACLEGAAVVHFQDFNAEVLQCLTVPNVSANLPKVTESTAPNLTMGKGDAEIRFFAGDWSEVHNILPHAHADEEPTSSPDLIQSAGYDVILMAETVYSISTLPVLYQLIKKCLNRPNGVVYMAAKKYYFGVGGGSRRFISVVEKDGVMAANLVAEVADGSSNVREVWKLQYK